MRLEIFLRCFRSLCQTRGMLEKVEKRRQRYKLLYSSRKQLRKSRMSKSAPCTKRLDCSGTNRTLIFESNVPRDLDLGTLIDSSEDTLPSVHEDCNNLQPSIMGSDFGVEDIATPMASLSESKDSGKISALFTSLCLEIQQCIGICPMNPTILQVRWQRF
jgi:hypothetical protein